MSRTTEIQGSAQRQQLVGSGITVLAPGYRGRVTQLDPAAAGGRAAGDPLPLAAAAAAAEVGVVAQLSVDLAPRLPALPQRDGSGRGGGPTTPKLILSRREGIDYAMLQTGEDGYSNWVLPAVTGKEVVFELAPPARPEPTSTGRGGITMAMRGIARIVAWAAQPVLAAGALAVVRAWERSKRPHAVRQVSREGRFVEPVELGSAKGPVLLLVHGTFSTPEAGFHGWVGGDRFNAVAERYGDRRLALAHPSLSASPDDNVDWLLEQLPAELKGPVDIVCHSRGGLVARGIAASGRLNVRRICQVGTPNNGTPLACAKHLISFLDGHTALLTALPDSVSTIVLEGLLCVVKLAATGAGHGLPGLVAMEPDGQYLTALGKRTPAAQQWFTVGADYQPDAAAASRFTQRAADAVVDRFFGAPNDLVVPSDGCHLPGVRVADSLRLAGGAVHHTNYFSNEQVHSRLTAWLTAPA